MSNGKDPEHNVANGTNPIGHRIESFRKNYVLDPHDQQAMGCVMCSASNRKRLRLLTD